MAKKVKMSVKTKELAKKVNDDANSIKEKYPELAKMTVAEVVATEEFANNIPKIVEKYKSIVNFYAWRSLKMNKTFEPDAFRKEYIACMDKQSNLPLSKRMIVGVIGNEVYKNTVKQMMEDYDKNK